MSNTCIQNFVTEYILNSKYSNYSQLLLNMRLFNDAKGRYFYPLDIYVLEQLASSLWEIRIIDHRKVCLNFKCIAGGIATIYRCRELSYGQAVRHIFGNVRRWWLCDAGGIKYSSRWNGQGARFAWLKWNVRLSWYRVIFDLEHSSPFCFLNRC